jgi:pyrroloquinoline quinone (PQQ) biosynthesis protein C
MKFYDELKQQTEQDRLSLLSIPLIERTMAGDVSRETYLAFLTEAYHHVKHTVPLLMACGSLLPEHYEWLRTAVGEYIREETGHQEWILDDIAACGMDRESIRNGRPGLATELMVAYAYDTIHRINPAGFFGMVYVLEGTSIQLATRAADIIQQQLGLPDAAFTYLRSHGALDLQHIEFFESLMNRLDDTHDKHCIIHCAQVMFRLYGDIFRSIDETSASEEAA